MRSLPADLLTEVPSDRAILLFDGVCNLCNGFVQFVLRRDHAGRVAFASLQSPLGQRVLSELALPTEQLGTVLFIEDGKVYERSDVALQLAPYLGTGWGLMRVFKKLPVGLRDGIYNWVARNRYRWFGKEEACMLPRPEWQGRFLSV